MLNINKGVPQGTLLAPFLFSLYLDGLFRLNFHSNVSAFADDTKMFGEVNLNFNLQDDLNLLTEWC